MIVNDLYEIKKRVKHTKWNTEEKIPFGKLYFLFPGLDALQVKMNSLLIQTYVWVDGTPSSSISNGIWSAPKPMHAKYNANF